jgi:hypothetical protein
MVGIMLVGDRTSTMIIGQTAFPMFLAGGVCCRADASVLERGRESLGTGVRIHVRQMFLLRNEDDRRFIECGSVFTLILHHAPLGSTSCQN